MGSNPDWGKGEIFFFFAFFFAQKWSKTPSSGQTEPFDLLCRSKLAFWGFFHHSLVTRPVCLRGPSQQIWWSFGFHVYCKSLVINVRKPTNVYITLHLHPKTRRYLLCCRSWKSRFRQFQLKRYKLQSKLYKEEVSIWNCGKPRNSLSLKNYVKSTLSV